MFDSIRYHLPEETVDVEASFPTEQLRSNSTEEIIVCENTITVLHLFKPLPPSKKYPKIASIFDDLFEAICTKYVSMKIFLLQNDMPLDLLFDLFGFRLWVRFCPNKFRAANAFAGELLNRDTESFDRAKRSGESLDTSFRTFASFFDYLDFCKRMYIVEPAGVPSRVFTAMLAFYKKRHRSETESCRYEQHSAKRRLVWPKSEEEEEESARPTAALKIKTFIC